MDEKEDIWCQIADMRKRLETVAASFCSSQADIDDLVSRTIERSLSRYALFDEGKGDIFVWMRAILVNLATDDARSRAIRKTEPQDPAQMEADESVATSDDVILRNSDSEAVREAIGRLAPEYKKTVVMHYMMDMPLKEIAKVLNRPIGTVKWRLSVAKGVLAGMLKRSLGRPGTWAALALGLLVGCVATAVVMRLPSRSPDECPQGGRSFNTPHVHEIAVPRTQRPVKVDGKLGEWAAPVFDAVCNPPYDRDYTASIRMMWDEERVYIGGDIRTPDPMRNNTAAAGRPPFSGGSVICRLAADDAQGWPLPDKTVYWIKRPPEGLLPDEGLVTLVLYYDSVSGRESLFAHRRMRKQNVFDVPRSAWSGAYLKHGDGRGYSFEYAIEWSAVGIAPPKPGETRANTWNIHFSDAAGIACTGQIVENMVMSIPEKYRNRSPLSACYFPPMWGRAVFEGDGMRYLNHEIH